MGEKALDTELITSQNNSDDLNFPIFEENEIAFYPNSVKLLRKGHPYTSIPYNSLNGITISKGYSTKNKLYSLVIFGLLFITATYVLYINRALLFSLSDRGFTEYFNTHFILNILGPMVAFFVSISSIVLAFTRHPVLHFNYNGIPKEIKLKEVVRKKQLDIFIMFLESKTKLITSLKQ